MIEILAMVALLICGAISIYTYGRDEPRRKVRAPVAPSDWLDSARTAYLRDGIDTLDYIMAVEKYDGKADEVRRIGANTYLTPSGEYVDQFGRPIPSLKGRKVPHAVKVLADNKAWYVPGLGPPARMYGLEMLSGTGASEEDELARLRQRYGTPDAPGGYYIPDRAGPLPDTAVDYHEWEQ
jgi:hypothetical protein